MAAEHNVAWTASYFDQLVSSLPTASPLEVSRACRQLIEANADQNQQTVAEFRSVDSGVREIKQEANLEIKQEAEEAVEQLLQLPSQPGLSAATTEKIVEAVAEFKIAKKRYDDQKQEHATIIKRLQQSKRSLKEENMRAVSKVTAAFKLGMLEARQHYEQHIQQVEADYQRLADEHEAKKQAIWDQLLKTLANDFKAVIGQLRHL